MSTKQQLSAEETQKRLHAVSAKPVRVQDRNGFTLPELVGPVVVIGALGLVVACMVKIGAWYYTNLSQVYPEFKAMNQAQAQQKQAEDRAYDMKQRVLLKMLKIQASEQKARTLQVPMPKMK